MNLTTGSANSQKAASVLEISDKLYTASIAPQINLNFMNLTAKPANSQKAADVLKISDKLYTAFIKLKREK